MKFDKTKVYTTFNADEVKIGSKGYVSDSKEYLIKCVQLEDKEHCLIIKGVEEATEYPFRAKAKDDVCMYRYFYLVEDPKEKTKRPCTKEELIEMLKKQGILMLKTIVGDLFFTIASMSDNNVYIGSENQSYECLCKYYTLLDGTELWVKE